jgi:hypothetical protein
MQHCVMSVGEMEASEESYGDPHVEVQGVTTVEWLMFHWYFAME